jgi:heme exporter protein CcmD
MDISAPHLGFVMLSYGLFAAVLLAVLCYAIWNGRKLKQELQNRNLSDPGARPGGADKKP